MSGTKSVVNATNTRDNSVELLKKYADIVAEGLEPAVNFDQIAEDVKQAWKTVMPDSYISARKILGGWVFSFFIAANKGESANNIIDNDPLIYRASINAKGEYVEDMGSMLVAPTPGSYMVYSTIKFRKTTIKDPTVDNLVKRFKAIRAWIIGNIDKIIDTPFDVYAKFGLADQVTEAWADSKPLNPAKKGMFDGMSKAELEKELAALKQSGPHERGSADNKKMHELEFALRAKNGWGKVTEGKEKIYVVTCETDSGRGNNKITGTLEELIDSYSYTLETGRSYESEKGNKKINCHPRTIGDLVKNLNNAVNNAAANGYAGKHYIAKLAPENSESKEKNVSESWADSKPLNPAKKGMFDGMSKAELEKELAALKQSGPHKKGSPEYTKEKELAFAIRAKSGWGKVGVDESSDLLREYESFLKQVKTRR